MGFNLVPEGLEASATVKTQRVIAISGASTGAHATMSDEAVGVSQDWSRATDTTNNDHAQSGEPMGLQESLRVKIQAGGAITAGKRIRADDDGTGRVVEAALAENAVGICLNTIAAEDELAEVWVHSTLGGLISLYSVASASGVDGILDFADMTDVTTTGTIDTGINLQAGDVVLGSRFVVSLGFIGDASATLDLGDGSTTDLYTPNSPSGFVDATVVYDYDSAPIPAAAATDVELTVTVATNFTDVTAGKVKVNMMILRMEP